MISNTLNFIGLILLFLTPLLSVSLQVSKSNGGRVIKNQYIITYKPEYLNSEASQLQEVSTLFTDNSKIIHHYPDLGFAAYLTKDGLTKVRNMEQVKRIEPDIQFHLNSVQRSAPWGLARLGSRNMPNFSKATYNYDNQGGSGVRVYVLDTGIDITHNQFKGRARWGTTIVSGEPSTDKIGHGTHVAGIVGSTTYGVAKMVDLVAVKIFDSKSIATASDIIAGIQWIVNDARNFRGGKVINMSFGSSKIIAVNDAVNIANDAGFVIAIAAGNTNVNACDYSPSSAIGGITVGATTIQDYAASFSNYGGCVDIFAPGNEIVSTWPNNQVQTLSGTSMAAPQIAGLAALILSSRKLNIRNPDEVKKYILSSATRNKLTKLKGASPNLLSYYSP